MHEESTMMNPRSLKLLAKAMSNASIASGAGMLFLPRSFARLYALPDRPPLIATLGVRDVAIGLLLHRPQTRRTGALARAAADMFDFGLILLEAAPKAPRRWPFLRLAGALASSALGSILATLLQEPDDHGRKGRV
jgi:hypothetical protein